MKTAKRNRLERAGWRLGSAEEFIDLIEEEQAPVEIIDSAFINSSLVVYQVIF